MDGGNEGELGVLEDLGVSSRELLILHLLADTSSADQAIVLASLAREFTITLGLLHAASLAGLPDPLMSAIHTSAVGNVVMVVYRGSTGAGTF